MTEANVIPFPQRSAPPPAPEPVGDFGDWMAWAESELTLLGFDLSATDYNWRAAHAKGLRPEVAADHAVRGLRAG